MNAEAVLKLLGEAYRRFQSGDQRGFDAHLAQARERIGDSAEERPLLGEYTLLSALPQQRDVESLIRLYDEAATYMQGRRSAIITAESAGGFCNDSAFWLLLKRPGTADAQAERFRMAMERLDALTGCGKGYPELYQAELAYQRGDLSRAQVMAYQAVYMANSTRQKRLSISAAKLIGYIAAHFYDVRDWSFAVRTVTEVVSADGKPMDPTDPLMRTANVIRSELMMQVRDLDALPEWVREGNFDVSLGEGALGFNGSVHDYRIGFFDFPLAMLLHALYLLNTGQYARLLAADTMQRMFGIEDALICYRLYYGLLRGIAYAALNERARAQEAFSAAVRLVVPDGLWMPVGMFAPLADELIIHAVKENGGDVAAVRRLGRGFVDNAKKLREAVAVRDIDRLLTSRERDVALYAAQGLRNREIAEKLSVTEQTVKFHLTNIYSKLEIDSRSRLAAAIKSSAKDYTKV